MNWHIFSPFCSQTYEERNCIVHPVSYRPFLNSFATCRGVVCSAGFETCAEAMYLGKKLLVVPIRHQYEQACNAAALEEMGVTTLETLEDRSLQIWNWLENQHLTTIDEIAEPREVVEQILLQGVDAFTANQKTYP